MADTIVEIPGHDNGPDFSQFDFSLDNDYLPRDSDFHMQTSLSHYQHFGYDAYNPDVQPTLLKPQGLICSPQVFRKAAPDFDLSEHGNSARLTQEQMATLENHYQQVPKPKPEVRRSLADKMGIGIEKVNHWFQNRRQKAKSHRYSARSGSDGFSTPAPTTSMSIPLSMPSSETAISASGFVEGQSIHDPNTSSYNFDLNASYVQGHMLQQHMSRSSHTPGPRFDTSSNEAQSPSFHHGPTGASGWISDLDSISMTDALARPVGASTGTASPTSQSLAASQNYQATFHARDNEFTNSSPLNCDKTSRSGFINNASMQTLNSNVSSVGDSNSLMTPPHPTPPLPWLSSEFDSRRASDSSELAHNVEGMHLQHVPPNLGPVTASLGLSPHSSVVSANGIATPDTSPEQLAGQPYTPAPDLASRRKRSGPAALRPEASRSSSNNGPLSHSPRSSRNPSVSLAPHNGPRRTQSGQVLNNFRVQKPNSNQAQISPRNLQTHFERQASPHSQRRSVTDASNGSPKTHRRDPTRPSASAASANRPPAEYQHEFHIRSASSNKEGNGAFQLPRHANSSVPNLPTSTTQAHFHPTVPVPSQQDPQLMSHYGTMPQSAPPHQKAFFGDSPINDIGPSLPPGSHVHNLTPSRQMDLTFGPNHGPQPNSFTPQGQYLPPFAPYYTFPDITHMTGYPAHGFLPSYQPPPAAQVELDIKVEVGPRPSLPQTQTFEKLEFNHTFSDKWPGGDKK